MRVLAALGAAACLAATAAAESCPSGARTNVTCPQGVCCAYNDPNLGTMHMWACINGAGSLTPEQVCTGTLHGNVTGTPGAPCYAGSFNATDTCSTCCCKYQQTSPTGSIIHGENCFPDDTICNSLHGTCV